MKEKISGLITTLNEERNIAECIQSLRQICDEIIVVDSGSNDNTVLLAKENGAKVYVQSYLGDGFQKNVGLQYASHRWIFSLDADERVMPELAEIINRLDLSKTSFDGFAVRRRNLIGSRWVRCCNWYPDYLVRLYRHDKLRFIDTKQHAYIPMKNTLKLKGDIMHYRYQNIGELFAKPARNYSTRSAKIMYLNGRRANAFSAFHHAFWSFTGNYFFRKGISNGADGFTLSLSMAVNAYLKYAKLLEYQRDPKVRETENFNEVW